MKAIFRGRQDYIPLWREMQDFTNNRNENTPDTIWFVEHPPVFTLGLNANKEHLLSPGKIPVIEVDRGGQVTFHGPGQLMVYPLIDLQRMKVGVRDLLTALEQSIIDLAASYSIDATKRPEAPGVYVNNRKLASIGLRIRRGSSFHGLALNVSIDLEPFERINPCGYSKMKMVDLQRLGINLSLEDAAGDFLPLFLKQISFFQRYKKF
ncbi:MAG: octanoyltransferase [Gammaproteobacteria bacterium]|nr:octanoyltransferase [Gammaproteobacteria bacterium]|tara:strand:+ start:1774 stop:2397 length:624 start_codon:yes stop_codon:yes gene_type:complete